MASSSNAFFSGLEIEKVEVKKRFTTNEIHAVFSIENLEENLMVAESKQIPITFPEILVGDHPFTVKLDSEAISPNSPEMLKGYKFGIGIFNSGPKDLKAIYRMDLCKEYEKIQRDLKNSSSTSIMKSNMGSYPVKIKKKEKIDEVLKFELFCSVLDDYNNDELEIYRAVTRGRTFTDFTIRSKEGEEYPCHRLFLASQSKVMLAMLETEMKEKETSSLDLNHDKKTVKAFVDFFYTGVLEKKSIKEDCGELLDLAVAYDHGRLRERIVRGMTDILDTSNMIEFFFLADFYELSQLKDVCSKYIVNNKSYVKKNLHKLKEKVSTDQAMELIMALL